MEIFNDLLTSPDMSASTMSADTIYLDGKPLTWGSGTTEPITIILDQIVHAPQQTIFVVQKEVYNFRPQEVSVVTRKTIIPTPPHIVTVTNKQAKLRICGDFTGPDSKVVECCKCVDNYIANNEITSYLQLTSKGSGCSVRKPNSAVSSTKLTKDQKRNR